MKSLKFRFKFVAIFKILDIVRIISSSIKSAPSPNLTFNQPIDQIICFLVFVMQINGCFYGLSIHTFY
jgi:hypothetical protein